MIYKIIFVALSICYCSSLKAQDIRANTDTVATRIAQKMQDSLNLSAVQKKAIRTINLKLQDDKMMIRDQYTNTDSITVKMQQVENTRDFFYKDVLTQQQYQTYKQKKRNLISPN